MGAEGGAWVGRGGNRKGRANKSNNVDVQEKDGMVQGDQRHGAASWTTRVAEPPKGVIKFAPKCPEVNFLDTS